MLDLLFKIKINSRMCNTESVLGIVKEMYSIYAAKDFERGTKIGLLFIESLRLRHFNFLTQAG